MRERRRTMGLLAFGIAAAWLGGAASARADDDGAVNDPFEGFNRKVFWFNEKVDRFVLEPIAKGWDFVLPDLAQRGLRNVLDNASFPVTFTNDLLQLHFKDAALTTGRFLLNSTVGWGGLFEAGDAAGWEAHSSDFGQTLGIWGAPAGPYLVLPLLGPSSPREAVGAAVDGAARVWPWFAPFWVSFAVRGTEVVNLRARLLEEIAENREQAFDYYVFFRNAYVQYRANLVTGDEQTEESDDDLYYPEDEEE